MASYKQFMDRYALVLEACVRRLQHLKGKFATRRELAQWVAGDLPTLYAKTFCNGRERSSEKLHVKVWRVQQMLSTAVFLGAVRGKGMQSVIRVVRKAG
jgi:hypothetical protein